LSVISSWGKRVSDWRESVVLRRLLWVLALIVLLGALVSAIWWLPSALTGHPSAGVTATARLGAENAARAALVAAVALVAAATLTARYTWRAAKLTEEGQITDRYTKAIEQLGGDKLDVRIGGIYALERIAHDAAQDQPTVMEVLTAFLREHSREHARSSGANPAPFWPGDVKAAVTVVARRTSRHDRGHIIDLTGANLSNASLLTTNLRGWLFIEATLTGANLTGADLSYANLYGATLTGADLSYADLTFAKLNSADLTGATLTDADLTDADLTGALLSETDLVPEGWRRDPETGRLGQAQPIGGSGSTSHLAAG
jgi:hypothetical protein